VSFLAAFHKVGVVNVRCSVVDASESKKAQSVAASTDGLLRRT
jgi:hypothetical protein